MGDSLWPVPWSKPNNTYLLKIAGNEFVKAIVFDPGVLDTHTFVWNFDDGSEQITSDVPVINHLFETPGEYDIILTVIDDDGGEGSASFVLKVGGNQPPIIESVPDASADEALEGLSIAIRHTDGSATKVLRVLDSSEEVHQVLKGDLGDRLFRLIKEGQASALGRTDEWPGFISTLFSIGREGGTPFSNLFSGSHVLF